MQASSSGNYIAKEALKNSFVQQSRANGVITSHVSILNDGGDNLKPEYDTGDHIHENVAGRQVIANAWRDKLIADQILSV